MPTPPTPINHDINLDEASAATKDYRESHPGEVYAFALPKADYLELINQTGCEYVRIYLAINDKGEKQAVAVAADSAMNDMYTGKLKDRMYGSPPYPSAANPLNS